MNPVIDRRKIRNAAPALFAALAAAALPALLMLLLALGAGGCRAETEQPKYYEIFTVSGTPYERGYQHGQHFADKIRSLYTMLLSNSILPYLNREQPDVAEVCLRYQDELYDDGRFSYQVMLDSGLSIAETLPREYLDELHGVADGAGMSYESVLVLNTFFDSLMGFRSVAFFIKLMQAPHVTQVAFEGGLDSDGADNDGDGVADEPGEGTVEPYEPGPYAAMVEVPTDARIRIILEDPNPGVDPESLRLQLDRKLYVYGDPSIEVRPVGPDGRNIEVIFTPPGGLPAASTIPLIIQAADNSVITDPPPAHARVMRDERVTFTTVGYGAKPIEVANRGVPDGRTQPPSIGFAVRGSATKDGRILVAHHFAMLDSNTSHKHTVLFINKPKNGKPFAYLSWTGLVWGFSGMNSRGVTYLANSSDTLNNAFLTSFNEGLIFARLVSAGTPVGIMGRMILENAGNADEALDVLRNQPATFGWNFLVADAKRNMAAAEVESNVLGEEGGGFIAFSPDDDPATLDPWGGRIGSLTPDDLRIASHFLADANEIDYRLLMFDLRPQRYWSTFYFRSVKAYYILGEQISRRLGKFDVAAVAETLRMDELVDHRDSMNAVIFEPELLKLHFAMGQVPATAGPFKGVDLAPLFGQEAAP